MGRRAPCAHPGQSCAGWCKCLSGCQQRSEPPMKRRATDQKVADGMQASADDANKLILAFWDEP